MPSRRRKCPRVTAGKTGGLAGAVRRWKSAVFTRKRLFQFVGFAAALALGRSSTEAQVDTTPPTVSITSPASGTTYTAAQRVLISAAASDNVGVQKVEFYNGTTLKATVTVKPYTFSWSFGAGANGVHEWTAKAYDLNNNVATSKVVTLTVNIAAAGGTGGSTGGTGGTSGTTGDGTPPIPGIVAASKTQSGSF